MPKSKYTGWVVMAEKRGDARPHRVKRSSSEQEARKEAAFFNRFGSPTELFWAEKWETSSVCDLYSCGVQDEEAS